MTTDRFACYRDAPRYGWPFYVARKAVRAAGNALLRAADGLSQREKYTPASNFRTILPENAALKDRHRGRRCFVIGNGPSLARQDLAPLAGEVTIAMNAFVRHPLVRHVRPTYYLFADHVFFDGTPQCDAFLAGVRDAVTDSTFLAPLACARTIAGRGLLPQDCTRYVAYAGMLRSANVRDIDLTRTVPAVINCAQLAIMTAIYTGCSQIYLLGLDHDWLASRVHEGHFYAGKTLPNHAVAHGDPQRWPYRDQLRSAGEAWDGYIALREYAERRGTQIVNCTAGGFLDVFPRQAYEPLVDLPAPPVAAAA